MRSAFQFALSPLFFSDIFWGFSGFDLFTQTRKTSPSPPMSISLVFGHANGPHKVSPLVARNVWYLKRIMKHVGAHGCQLFRTLSSASLNCASTNAVGNVSGPKYMRPSFGMVGCLEAEAFWSLVAHTPPTAITRDCHPTICSQAGDARPSASISLLGCASLFPPYPPLLL